MTDSSVKKSRGSLQNPTKMDRFAAALRGPLIRSGDGHYDDTREIWNGLFDRQPALAGHPKVWSAWLRPLGLRKNRLRVLAWGGGHYAASCAASDGGLVIDLQAMRKVEVDPESRVICTGAGATPGDPDCATQAHGWQCRPAWSPTPA